MSELTIAERISQLDRVISSLEELVKHIPSLKEIGDIADKIEESINNLENRIRIIKDNSDMIEMIISP